MKLKGRGIKKHTNWSHFQNRNFQLAHTLCTVHEHVLSEYCTAAVAGILHSTCCLTCVVSQRLSLTFCCIHENIDSVAVITQELINALAEAASSSYSSLELGCGVPLKLKRNSSGPREVHILFGKAWIALSVQAC